MSAKIFIALLSIIETAQTTLTCKDYDTVPNRRIDKCTVYTHTMSDAAVKINRLVTHETI